VSFWPLLPERSPDSPQNFTPECSPKKSSFYTPVLGECANLSDCCCSGRNQFLQLAHDRCWCSCLGEHENFLLGANAFHGVFTKNRGVSWPKDSNFARGRGLPCPSEQVVRRAEKRFAFEPFGFTARGRPQFETFTLATGRLMRVHKVMCQFISDLRTRDRTWHFMRIMCSSYDT